MSRQCLGMPYRIDKCSRVLVGGRYNPGQIANLTQNGLDKVDTLYHGFLVMLVAQVRRSRNPGIHRGKNGHSTARGRAHAKVLRDRHCS